MSRHGIEYITSFLLVSASLSLGSRTVIVVIVIRVYWFRVNRRNNPQKIEMKKYFHMYSRV